MIFLSFIHERDTVDQEPNFGKLGPLVGPVDVSSVYGQLRIHQMEPAGGNPVQYYEVDMEFLPTIEEMYLVDGKLYSDVQFFTPDENDLKDWLSNGRRLLCADEMIEQIRATEPKWVCTDVDTNQHRKQHSKFVFEFKEDRCTNPFTGKMEPVTITERDDLVVVEVMNHFSDNGYRSIDAYFCTKSGLDVDSGRVVAIVCEDTKKVYFIDNGLRENTLVVEAINEVLEQLTLKTDSQ